MSGALHRYLTADHAAAARELAQCVRADGTVDLSRFDAFRRRLLQHIAIEEKVLRPALVAAGCSPVFQNELRKDHAGIAALCVPVPCAEWVNDLKELLEHHHHVEEAPQGFYAKVSELLTDEGAIFERIASLPQVRIPPFESGPKVREQLRAVLYETGISANEFPLKVMKS